MNMIKALMLQEQLFPEFEEKVLPHYKRLADYLAQQHAAKQSPFLVAINGAQGTGKSTLALFLQALLQTQGKRVAVLSIDDLYYTHQERQQLAAKIHPLLKTRGVPGTHDLALGQYVINQLLEAQAGDSIPVPAFDKAQDDRKPQAQWHSIEGPVDIVLLEGWCVAATPMPKEYLANAINQLEADEDAQQTWRAYVNDQLANNYQNFFRQFDCLVMLKAPSFDCVKQWRALQEEKLARKMQVELNKKQTTNNGALNAPLRGLMDSNALNRFMMHYERLTTHMLNEMPERANVLIELALDHSVQHVAYKGEALND
jgi:D-glycerate 3-kinase